MSSKQQLTDKSLIELLEKQRFTFTDRYLPLRTIQETALRKANDLIAEPPEALKRNYSKKKANAILNDIKNCISYDVFVLCALATNLSALGTSKLGNYVSKISLWWEGVHHPKGLTMVSERYGTRISNVSLNDKLTSDELPKGEPLSSGQTSELAARTPVGQNAFSTPTQDREDSTTNMEATQAPANNQVAEGDKAGPSQAPTNEKTNTNATKDDDKIEPSQGPAKYDGDAFIVDINNARYALSLNEHVGEIWLTNRKNEYNANDEKNRSFLDKKRKSFITLWISEALGEELGKRSKQMVDCTSDEVQHH